MGQYSIVGIFIYQWILLLEAIHLVWRNYTIMHID
jgi:hypothetical protein